MSDMTPLLFIRKSVFGCKTQQEFADLLGITQVTVCNSEKEDRVSSKMQGRILKAVDDQEIHFEYKWFFEVPESEVA